VFRKIQEAISAFRPRELPSRDGLTAEQIHESHQRMLESHRHERPEIPRPNLGVVIAVILPASWFLALLMSQLVHSAFPVSANVQGLASIFSALFAILLSYFSGAIEGTIRERIPFGRLNPYFGRKLAESAAAFKKHA